MIQIDGIVDFVREDYARKDSMHNLSHIQRIERLARKLAADREYDPELLMLGAYFHGIIYSKEEAIRRFLKAKLFLDDRIERVLKIAWESQKEGRPETVEGLSLHDAHLIEGGKTFIITKSFVTGTARNQTLNETIHFIEENVLGKFRCYLPEAQNIYEEKERFARDFLDDLKRHL